MRDWIIRCGSTRCNHVGRENDLVPRKTKNPLVTQLVCPKCGCKSYSKATPKEVERFNAQQQAAACDCGGFPHGKHCAAVMAGHEEHTPTTPNGE